MEVNSQPRNEEEVVAKLKGEPIAQAIADAVNKALMSRPETVLSSDLEEKFVTYVNESDTEKRDRIVRNLIADARGSLSSGNLAGAQDALAQISRLKDADRIMQELDALERELTPRGESIETE
jgi:hypothetical protein